MTLGETAKGRLGCADARIGVLFVLPVLVLFVAFRFGPALAGLGLSVFQYGPGEPLVPAGLDNSFGWSATRCSGVPCG